MPKLNSRRVSRNVWVDPASLPKYGDAADIQGNAPDYVKQLTSNTLGAYGVGDSDNFAYTVGIQIKLVEVNVDRKGDKWEVTTGADILVSKGVCRTSPYLHPHSYSK
ncbi:hypothetical protein PHLCEN_2v2696 [Hermanssonia centrifuga]|uniref:Uncharacterized protein n=1 Tax=Hermanssonia centrifuga TaxID=98765 RepID=A0A2R6RIF1_9APHY|nr:hypothetical protein PHLCEN_2v2696 [Hermanssonia centrifuga]